MVVAARLQKALPSLHGHKMQLMLIAQIAHPMSNALYIKLTERFSCLNRKFSLSKTF